MAYPSVNYHSLINRYSDIERHKACIARELGYYPNRYTNINNHSRAVTALTPDGHTVVILHLKFDNDPYKYYEIVSVSGPDFNKLTNEIIPDVWRKISRATEMCG